MKEKKKGGSRKKKGRTKYGGEIEDGGMGGNGDGNGGKKGERKNRKTNKRREKDDGKERLRWEREGMWKKRKD